MIMNRLANDLPRIGKFWGEQGSFNSIHSCCIDSLMLFVHFCILFQEHESWFLMVVTIVNPKVVPMVQLLVRMFGKFQSIRMIVIYHIFIKYTHWCCLLRFKYVTRSWIMTFCCCNDDKSTTRTCLSLARRCVCMFGKSPTIRMVVIHYILIIYTHWYTHWSYMFAGEWVELGIGVIDKCVIFLFGSCSRFWLFGIRWLLTNILACLVELCLNDCRYCFGSFAMTHFEASPFHHNKGSFTRFAQDSQDQDHEFPWNLEFHFHFHFWWVDVRRIS